MFRFSFFPIKTLLCLFEFVLIRPNQLETTFTGKKSTGECLKYNIFEFVFRLFFRGSMLLEGTWQKAGGQSGFKLQLSLVFFPVVVSFFVLFLSLGITCFPSFFSLF